MVKSALIVAVSILAALASATSAGWSPADTRVLSYEVVLTGPVGSGFVQYEEWGPIGPEMSQRLHVVVRRYTPFAKLRVIMDGRGVGWVTTDRRGAANETFWNPPVEMPRIRPGSIVEVGDLAGRIIEDN